MKDFDIEINPITKFQIYAACKKVIFSKVDNLQMSPEKADEILLYIKYNIVNIDTPQQAKLFYTHLGEKFKELKTIEKMFEMQTLEKIENIILFIIEDFMEEGNIEMVEEVMDYIKDNKISLSIIDQIRGMYPFKFEKALKKLPRI